MAVHRRVSVDLSPDLDAPAAARALVTREGAGLDPALVADAVLCVSEVVSNAVVHGRPGVTLTLTVRDGGVRIEVTDHGDLLDPTRLRPAGEDSIGGRGLHIVAALARDWGVRAERTAGREPGKTVWFTLTPGARGVPVPSVAGVAR